MLSYAGHFISLATTDYQSVWWRIFHSPNCKEWTNLLIFIQLLFALPASNGKIERVFSQLNIIKTDKRTTLCNETIDNLLTLNTSKCPLKDFSPDNQLGFGGKLNQGDLTRAKEKYTLVVKKTTSSATSSSTSLLESESTRSYDDGDDDEYDHVELLDDWDEWMNPNDADIDDSDD